MGNILRVAMRLYTCSPPLQYAVRRSSDVHSLIFFTILGFFATSQVEQVSSRSQLSGILNNPGFAKITPMCIEINPVCVTVDTYDYSDQGTDTRNMSRLDVNLHLCLEQFLCYYCCLFVCM